MWEDVPVLLFFPYKQGEDLTHRHNVGQTRNHHKVRKRVDKSDQHWLGGREQIWQTVSDFFSTMVNSCMANIVQGGGGQGVKFVEKNFDP